MICSIFQVVSVWYSKFGWKRFFYCFREKDITWIHSMKRKKNCPFINDPTHKIKRSTKEMVFCISKFENSVKFSIQSWLISRNWLFWISKLGLNQKLDWIFEICNLRALFSIPYSVLSVKSNWLIRRGQNRTLRPNSVLDQESDVI